MSTPERRRYSTGFRIWLAGVSTAALGAVLWAFVWAPLGIALIVVGVVPAMWYRWPTDWRRTWPDDFPILSRLVGAHRSRTGFHGDVYEDSQRAWRAQPARRRLIESVIGILVAVSVDAWAAIDPRTYFSSSYHARGLLLLAVSPFLLVESFERAHAAWNDLRNS